MKHYRDVAISVLKNRLVYRIPLYLPQERHLFQTTELVLEVPFKHLPDVLDHDEVNKKALQTSFKTVELELKKLEEMK